MVSPHRLSLAVFHGPAFNNTRHPPDILVEILRQALEKFRQEHRVFKIAGACVGVAGVDHSHEKERLIQNLKTTLAEIDEIWVLSDAEVAFYTMFGDRSGVLLIAGTGSIALGRDEHGRWFRAGGLGILLGDEGSGSWIGLQAVKAAIRAREERGPNTHLELEVLKNQTPREFLESLKEPYAETLAQLFPKVMDLAKKGDQVAQNILDEAVKELLSLVQSVRKQMGTTDPNFGYHGGLFRSSEFRSLFVKGSQRINLSPLPLPEDPSMGAARYALKSLT